MTEREYCVSFTKHIDPTLVDLTGYTDGSGILEVADMGGQLICAKHLADWEFKPLTEAMKAAYTEDTVASLAAEGYAVRSWMDEGFTDCAGAFYDEGTLVMWDE